MPTPADGRVRALLRDVQRRLRGQALARAVAVGVGLATLPYLVTHDWGVTAGVTGLGVTGQATVTLAVGIVGLDRVQLLERGPQGWAITATSDAGDGPRHLVGADLEA